jgi:D-tyrosyl-tRNA(Tyr) deacylase
MLALVQRVTEARVDVDGTTVASIGPGLLVLVCAEPGDGAALAGGLVERLLTLRVFADAAGRMNRSLVDVGGGLLLVPQFTLAATVAGGNRPSFDGAAPPAEARVLFDAVIAAARARHAAVGAGIFGAHMQLRLVNDGPVTIPLQLR